MNYEEVKKATEVLNHIDDIRCYVSKERFSTAAKCRFNITDEKKIDQMYSAMNMFPKIMHLIGRMSSKNNPVFDYLPQAMEIAEAAYDIRQKYDNDILTLEDKNDSYYKDYRRYFYQMGDNKEISHIDVSMRSRYDIVMFGDLLKRDDVKIIGVTHYLEELETKEVNENNRNKKVAYYDGDIYFLFNDPFDRIFYDWYSHGDDAGVYIATDKGWRKLLYTPGRGYLDKKGELDFVDGKHFYSDYMLEASGKDFKYIGNIHCDASVLSERKPEVTVENNDEDEEDDE